jgi:hypothetical protein
MTRAAPALEGTLEEVKLGQASWKWYYKTKIRNIGWAMASAIGAAITVIVGIALARRFLEGVMSEGGALILTKYLVVFFYLIMTLWAAWMIRTMHRQDNDQQPMFAETPIPKFEPLPPPADGDWSRRLRKGVRIGRWQQDSKGNRPGAPAWMPIKGMPGVLCAGESGQGKSSFIWGILSELTHDIKARVVQPVVFDYKVGLELDAVTGTGLVGHKFFHCGDEVGSSDPIQDGWDRHGDATYMGPRGVTWTYEETVIPHLRKYVQIMRMRAQQYRDEGSGREHVPAPGDPHYVLLVDEAGQFFRDHVPNAVQEEISGLFDTLANQARACGFTLVACTQYPSLEYIKFRHGLLWGLCLKVKTPRAVDMVLGEGAWLSGKRADKLPRDEKHPERFAGIGYMSQSGAFGAMPLRLAYTGPDLNSNGVPDDLEPKPVRRRLDWGEKPELDVVAEVREIRGYQQPPAA